jgi:hypothetical protein
LDGIKWATNANISGHSGVAGHCEIVQIGFDQNAIIGRWAKNKSRLQAAWISETDDRSDDDSERQRKDTLHRKASS